MQFTASRTIGRTRQRAAASVDSSAAAKAKLGATRSAYFVERVARLGGDAPDMPTEKKFCLATAINMQKMSSSTDDDDDVDFFTDDCCTIRCAAVRFEALHIGARNVLPPALYNQTVIDALRAGSESLAAVMDAEPHLLNSQNLSGVTLLMKACRLVSPCSSNQRAVVQVLIDRGADVMLCCDSGRNALHDLFWGTALFTEGHERETEPEEILESMLAAYGRRRMLALMMAPDHHGNTPLEFTCGRRWRNVVDLVVNYGAQAPSPGSAALGSEMMPSPLPVVLARAQSGEMMPSPLGLVAGAGEPSALSLDFTTRCDAFAKALHSDGVKLGPAGLGEEEEEEAEPDITFGPSLSFDLGSGFCGNEMVAARGKLMGTPLLVQVEEAAGPSSSFDLSSGFCGNEMVAARGKLMGNPLLVQMQEAERDPTMSPRHKRARPLRSSPRRAIAAQ